LKENKKRSSGASCQIPTHLIATKTAQHGLLACLLHFITTA